jgi:hypothetical protein
VEAIEYRRRLVEDFELFCETCLVVEAKDQSGLTPLVLKPVQKRLARTMLDQYASGKPVRIVILKARREGVSTLIQAFFFWLCALRPHHKAMTIAHDDDGSSTLHGMSERFYDGLPAIVTPMRKTSQSGKLLQFANPSSKTMLVKQDPGLGSEMRTVTRQNAGAGKGAKFLHCSEVGLWGENAKDTLGTILQTIPRAPRTIVALESTARGVGNEFHSRWTKAESGTSEYIAFFIPWYEEPENRLPPPDWFDHTDDDEEIENELEWLTAEFDLDDEQLWWWRRVLEDECGGDLNLMHQEYPATAEQAFLSTGRPYFNMAAVGRHLESASKKKPLHVGDLHEEGRVVKFLAHPRGHLRIWEPPDEHEDYLIFADSSEGSLGDPQCAYVFCRSKLEICARWHGRVDRDLLGDELFRLGILYNTALIAPEMTGGWGYSVTTILKRRGYPRIYKRKAEDRRQRKRSEQYGFHTTPVVRAQMLDSLNQVLRNDELAVNDPQLPVECSTFVYLDAKNANGESKIGAQPGKHDDCVIAAAGGVYLWLNEPRRHEPVEHPQRRVLSSVAGY